MDLRTVVDASQVAVALTVIGGTVFAVLLLNELKRQRQETALAYQLHWDRQPWAALTQTSIPGESANFSTCHDALSCGISRPGGGDVRRQKTQALG